MRQLLTEAMLVSLTGGAIGLAGGIVILRVLSIWQPIPEVPINVARESPRTHLRRGASAGGVQRIAVWDRAGPAGAAIASAPPHLQALQR